MVIPVTFPKTARFWRPPGTSDYRLQPNSLTRGNLERGMPRVKQKRQASADFLGVMAIQRNVVDGCCIPTTILTDISLD